VDNEMAGRLATQHLLDLGHRAIGCIAGPSKTDGFAARVEGYRRALAEAGIEARAEWIIETADLTAKTGFVAAGRLLENAGLTAIFGNTDIVAVGALRYAAVAGIAVPGKLSIVGLDGIELGHYVSPALTSVAQPIGRIGEVAVTSLLECIDRGGRSACRYLKLAPELVVRESSGPVPRTARRAHLK
ncbi:MAG: substrate-binding domain-containing protein, partial [Verrucomicrobia bacterium]|nr:substrate-binding domain-containing protein [Verrucomicrobiota bacterium]